MYKKNFSDTLEFWGLNSTVPDGYLNALQVAKIWLVMTEGLYGANDIPGGCTAC